MEYAMPDYIQHALKELERAVHRDNYNLSRDDHDAISVEIRRLHDFIQEKYDGKNKL